MGRLFVFALLAIVLSWSVCSVAEASPVRPLVCTTIAKKTKLTDNEAIFYSRKCTGQVAKDPSFCSPLASSATMSQHELLAYALGCSQSTPVVTPIASSVEPTHLVFPAASTSYKAQALQLLQGVFDQAHVTATVTNTAATAVAQQKPSGGSVELPAAIVQQIKEVVSQSGAAADDQKQQADSAQLQAQRLQVQQSDIKAAVAAFDARELANRRKTCQYKASMTGFFAGILSLARAPKIKDDVGVLNFFLPVSFAHCDAPTTQISPIVALPDQELTVNQTTTVRMLEDGYDFKRGAAMNSSNPGIASVSVQQGNAASFDIKGVTPGSAMITASDAWGQTKTFVVTVVAKTPDANPTATPSPAAASPLPK